MGYSVDSLPDAYVVGGTAINTQVKATVGSHMLRVKGWAEKTVCISDVAITVSNPPPTLIPSYAISSGDLNGNSKWKCQHDDGTSGSSTGGIAYPLTVGGYKDVQKFEISSYANFGGERCSIDFVKDTTTHNFIYDVWVQFPNPALLGNLELDLNQVTLNGDTVIFAFQCDGFKGKWDYSYVSDPAGGAGGTHWIPSELPCNPRTWTADSWHHLQIYTTRDDSGNVTYNWVAFDGIVDKLNVTTFQEEALRWNIGDTIVNFQMDPAKASGDPVVVYAHNLTIYRW
jgi:hypothetical protein